MNECPITELERRHLISLLEDAYAELDASDEISQGVIDGVKEAIETLGGSVE